MTLRTKKFVSNVWLELLYITRYAGSGIFNTIVGFIIIFSAMYLGASPLGANMFGYAIGFMQGFVISKKFVFRSNGHFVSESFRYLIAFVVSFILNILVLKIAIDIFFLNSYLSQVISSLAYTCLMYILVRYFVFNLNLSSKE